MNKKNIQTVTSLCLASVLLLCTPLCAQEESIVSAQEDAPHTIRYEEIYASMLDSFSEDPYPFLIAHQQKVAHLYSFYKKYIQKPLHFTATYSKTTGHLSVIIDRIYQDSELFKKVCSVSPESEIFVHIEHITHLTIDYLLTLAQHGEAIEQSLHIGYKALIVMEEKYESLRSKNPELPPFKRTFYPEQLVEETHDGVTTSRLVLPLPYTFFPLSKLKKAAQEYAQLYMKTGDKKRAGQAFNEVLETYFSPALFTQTPDEFLPSLTLFFNNIDESSTLQAHIPPLYEKIRMLFCQRTTKLWTAATTITTEVHSCLLQAAKDRGSLQQLARIFSIEQFMHHILSFILSSHYQNLLIILHNHYARLLSSREISTNKKAPLLPLEFLKRYTTTLQHLEEELAPFCAPFSYDSPQTAHDTLLADSTRHSAAPPKPPISYEKKHKKKKRHGKKK